MVLASACSKTSCSEESQASKFDSGKEREGIAESLHKDR